MLAVGAVKYEICCSVIQPTALMFVEASYSVMAGFLVVVRPSFLELTH